MFKTYMQDIIVNRNTKFVNFSIYWLGCQIVTLN